jgi:NhaP-type Na+/H+ or K+/H+ antiporter
VQWALAVTALVVMGYAAVSRRLDGTPITAPIVFVGAGLLLGPKVLDLADPSPSGGTVRVLAEATLTLVLFSDASRIDLKALRREYAVPERLLGIGLPLTIALGAALAAATFGALTWAEAVVLAIVLAPTDAALGQSVVTEPRLPSRIRQGLSVESGLNDGICVPLLFVALAIADAESGGTTVVHAVRLVFEEIGYGALGGVAAGAAAAFAMNASDRRATVDAAWRQTLPLAGAALAYGIATPLGGSGFIAAFIAGVVFGAMRRRDGHDAHHLVEELGGLLNALTFFVFGAVLLGPTLGELSWQLVLYAVLSLTVVRMLPVALALRPIHPRRQTVAFVGWFGPRGLASIVFAVLLVEEFNLPHQGTLVLATFTTVGLSVLAHGLSAAPLTARYVRWFESHPREARPAMESVPAADQRWRRSGVASHRSTGADDVT